MNLDRLIQKVKKIRKDTGFKYKKAGVNATKLFDENEYQLDMFEILKSASCLISHQDGL